MKNKRKPHQELILNDPNNRPRERRPTINDINHKKALDKFEQLMEKKLTQDYWDSL